MFLKTQIFFISHIKLHESPLQLPLGPLSRVGDAFSMFSNCSTWCSLSLMWVDVVTTGSKIGGIYGSLGGGVGGVGFGQTAICL